MRRVAVIGGGDSGKTAVETLIGQGPSTGMSVAALDFPSQIDWYGAPYTNQADWCANIRGRYARIGKALGTRVLPKGKAPFYPTPGFDSVQMGPMTYDWIINCTGFKGGRELVADFDTPNYLPSGRTVAKRVAITGQADEVYLVGPVAGIDISNADTNAAPLLARIPENATSLFRYAPVTAAFAATLPMVSE